MPTYEYACTSCGHHLEVVQSFSAEPLTSCPNCGGALRKVFGSVGIVLKGSGFYKTDSRSQGSAGRTASSSKESGAGSTESPSPSRSPSEASTPAPTKAAPAKAAPAKAAGA